jgi:hypothetical protein
VLTGDAGYIPTAAELAAWFRARDAYLAGYLCEYDVAIPTPGGTLHACSRLDHARLPTPARAGSVIRALRGVGRR